MSSLVLVYVIGIMGQWLALLALAAKVKPIYAQCRLMLVYVNGHHGAMVGTVGIDSHG